MYLVLLFGSTNSFSQISPFNFDGVKNYDNGNTIAYFYVNGISDDNQAFFVQNELRKETLINRFFIYPYKNGVNRCMIDCSQELNENEIKDLINSKIEQYNTEFSKAKNLREFYLNLYSITNMPKYEDTGNRQDDVLKVKKEFEIWKNQNPDKYSLIRTIQIDTFIQK